MQPHLVTHKKIIYVLKVNFFSNFAWELQQLVDQIDYVGNMKRKCVHLQVALFVCMQTADWAPAARCPFLPGVVQDFEIVPECCLKVVKSSGWPELEGGHKPTEEGS